MSKILIHTTEMMEALVKGGLSEKTQEAFGMWADGYPSTEIGEVLKIHQDTANYHINRALKFLKKNYKGNF